MAQRPKYRTFDKNFNFNLRRDPHKISYERCAHERTYLKLCHEKRRKKESGHKWVNPLRTKLIFSPFFGT